MNKAHRSLWNASLGAWVAVSENSRARGKKSHRTAALTLGAASLVIASMSAFAGGNGGDAGFPGSPILGTTGSSVTGQGGTGGFGFFGTGGAGGAPGMNGGDGMPSPIPGVIPGGGGGGGSVFLGPVPVTSTIAAGNGGNGAAPFDPQSGSGAGGGGASTIAHGDVRIEAGGALAGGSGGRGGDFLAPPTFPAGAGYGGGGGAGLLVVAPEGTTTTISNAGSITGGNGGRAGIGSSGIPLPSIGARGGAGEGADADAAAASFVSLGGTGIVGSNLNVINSGTISGGFSGDGSTQASAIRFTGGTNRLELRAGSQLNGNVLANGSFDTLAFGGTESGAFNMTDMVNGKFQGFEAYEKTGSSTWTLTGSAYDMTITGLVREGTLRLGDGDGAGGLIVGVDGQETPAISTPGGSVGQNGGAGTVALAVSGGRLVLEDEGYVRGGAGGSASTTELRAGGISSVTGAMGGAGATGVTLTGGTLTVENGGTSAGGRGGSGGAITVFSGGGLAPLPAVAAASMSLNVVVGAGGAGGSGVTTASGETIVNSGYIAGGGGGRGGGSQPEADIGIAGIRTSSTAILVSTFGETSAQVFTGAGGAGGNGGHGVLLTGTGGLQNNNFIRGGHGGDAGSLVGASLSFGAASSTITNAAGGTGGASVAYTGAGSLVNEGELRGGDGGVSSLGAAFAGILATGMEPANGTITSPATATVIGAVGASGGAGVYFGGAATVENRGLVQGGMGAGVTPPPPDFMAMAAPSTPTQSFALATSPQGPTTASATGNTGGTGGSALVLMAGGTANNRDSGELYGGMGGNGSGAQAAAASLNMAQASAVAVGGNGGNGGNGASLRGVSLFLNEGNVSGGRAGDGGSAKANSQSNTAVQAATLRATGGNGGTGGAGIAADNSTVVNRGTVEGGYGGLGATAVLQHENIGDGSSGSTVVYSVGTPGVAGAGGAGITGSNLQVTNAGNIYAGYSGDGQTLAPAIAFTGGVNSLTIERSSDITGLVLAHSTADTLALGGSDDSSFDVASAGPDGQYRGFGQFRKSGDATWTLTGSTTQVTPWTIAQGTLVVGADASLGDASGALTLAGGTLQTTASMATARAVVLSGPGGTLRTDTGTTLQIGGQVSGSGALTKDGTGTLHLSAVNSYTGGTRIAAGTLIGGANSFGTGAIVNDSALVIEQPTDATMVNDLSGKGSLTKSGAGAVRYTGNGSAFTGSLQVTGGVLSVNGSLGGTLNIESGGTLKGSGSVGSTVLASGATLAPGNSIGTLTVNGDFTFAPGSRYQVETDPSGASDLLRVTGTATLGGASVIVLAADGKWSPTTTYTILTSGTRVGTFGSVSSNFAFLDPSLSYKGGDVMLSLVRNTVAFPAVGITLNQRASGAALDSLGGGLLYNAVVQLDAPTARLAFDQLSGELHASVRSALIEDSRFVREAGADRLRQTQGGAGATGDLKTVEGADGGLWTRAYGSWGDTKGDGNAAKAKRDTRGVLVGADRRFGDWRLGVLGGAGSSSVSVDDRQSSAKIDSYHLGLYGGTEWGALALRTGASYTHHSIDTRRRIAFTGLGGTPEASYHAGTTQVFGELGWRMDAGTVALEPFANLAHVNLRTGGFTERASLAGLSGRSESGSTTFTTLGLRASTKLELGGTAATLRGMLGWRHAFGDVTPTAALAFMGGNAFTVTGVPVAKNAAVVEAGLDFAIKQDLTLGVSYNGQFGSGVKDHGLKANLLWKF
ncbi:autotransporter domain-containing protein [Variovorax sp. GB1P17]|uniref:autotransporter domain-containing protein n=1 Tax=Variovorax sp. GB1P17 TaxID=3443740 RepID=UPI003F452FB4